MPLIAVLDAIKLSLYHEKDGKHHEPHVHAVYNEYKAAYDFDGSLTRGEMPNPQKKDYCCMDFRASRRTV